MALTAAPPPQEQSVQMNVTNAREIVDFAGFVLDHSSIGQPKMLAILQNTFASEAMAVFGSEVEKEFAALCRKNKNGGFPLTVLRAVIDGTFFELGRHAQKWVGENI